MTYSINNERKSMISIRIMQGVTVSSFDDWDQSSSWGGDSGNSGSFGNSDSFGGGNDDWGERRPTASSVGTGGWHWLLTLVAIVIVAGLSMGMAWLTRNVEERPIWMMGLIFMVPTAALMLAAMLVESATSAMTPGTSRRPQLIIAAAATVATFIVACICDWIYLSKFKKEQPVPARSVVASDAVTDRLVLVCDPTATMNGFRVNVDETVTLILAEAGSTRETGMIRDMDHWIDPAPNQEALLTAMAGETADQGRLYYTDLLEKALDMADADHPERGIRIIFLTDGRHPWAKTANEDLTDLCIQKNAAVSFIIFGDEAPLPEMTALSRRTYGAVTAASGWQESLHGIDHTRYNETVSAAVIPKEVKLQQDLLRNRDPSAIIISFIMLILEGLSLGICLSLMLSVTGQFRAQYIISPVMGALAALLLKVLFPTDNMLDWWKYEGFSFSLLGIVLMARNNRPGYRQQSARSRSVSSDFSSTDF